MGGLFDIGNPIEQLGGLINDSINTIKDAAADVKDPNYVRKVLGLNQANDAAKAKRELAAKIQDQANADQTQAETLRQQRLLMQRSLIQTSPLGLTSFANTPNFWQAPGWQTLGGN